MKDKFIYRSMLLQTLREYLFRYLELTRFNDPSVPVVQLKNVYAPCEIGKIYLVGEAYIGKLKNFFTQEIIDT